jgi:leucyl/phenylalanyl-tRNA--protein transferase
MPVFQLSRKLAFPPPHLAEEDGLLAVGGDLGEQRLLLAYSLGIYPWYVDGYPILWWSPDPRLVLFPHELHVSRSLRQVIRKGTYEVTMDTAFEVVIRHCASAPRKGEEGTWITKEMQKAYTRLHRSGFAHSVETWHEGQLAGGLYGVALGGMFFGESMFTRRSDASKVAFVKLVETLRSWRFSMIDCQMKTGHLMKFGAREIPRSDFMRLLSDALRRPTRRGHWSLDTVSSACSH